MYTLSLVLLYLSTLTTAQDPQAAATKKCKAVPGDPSWPSKETWSTLRRQVSGRLIKTTPLAKSCYPGSSSNTAQCTTINSQWPLLDFETSQPIGRALPYNITCPPINTAAAEVPVRPCTLGINPVMAVNATNRADVKATIDFARKNNVRLVTTGTGHDLLGRSDGFGALELWLRYYRNNITFVPRYQGCGKKETTWQGGAMVIDGVYQWRDVSAVARKNNVFVATGGTPSVGAVGGWSQGGGHGPATTYVGWGVDQILEAEVMLADGRVVTANACENSDLYRSLRGGGPGYGVVLKMIVKAHPNVKVVTAHRLSMVPKDNSNDTSHLLDAITTLVQKSSDLTDGGVGGYGFWYNHYDKIAVENSTSGYKHSVYLMDKDEAYAHTLFVPIVKDLQTKYGKTVNINSSYVTYPDYWSFYSTEIAFEGPQGKTNIMTSRAITRNQTTNFASLRSAVEKISHAPGQDNSNCILFAGGPTIAAQGSDPNAGYQPAWRKAGFGLVTIRVIPHNITNAERDAVEKDMLDKTRVMQEFAPGMGSYMNEADRLDPNWIENFYGKENYAGHLKTKSKYDPENLFYCGTCVGSEAWVERWDGPLCKK